MTAHGISNNNGYFTSFYLNHEHYTSLMNQFCGPFDIDNTKVPRYYLNVNIDLKELIQKNILKDNRFSSYGELVGYAHNYFVKYYKYTLHPGAIDPQKNEVKRFLFGTKRGYCTHFASAAIMIFRTYGVPARMVQGYMVNGSRLKENMRANVYDRDAHAWVEIYIQGKGWMPIDMTPASSSDQENSRIKNKVTNIKVSKDKKAKHNQITNKDEKEENIKQEDEEKTDKNEIEDEKQKEPVEKEKDQKDKDDKQDNSEVEDEKDIEDESNIDEPEDEENTESEIVNQKPQKLQRKPINQDGVFSREFVIVIKYILFSLGIALLAILITIFVRVKKRKKKLLQLNNPNYSKRLLFMNRELNKFWGKIHVKWNYMNCDDLSQNIYEHTMQYYVFGNRIDMDNMFKKIHKYVDCVYRSRFGLEPISMDEYEFCVNYMQNLLIKIKKNSTKKVWKKFKKCSMVKILSKKGGLDNDEL